ncbi:hypothetical protein [Kordiimonas sp.]|uniref:hypothetical protein n=1 Tax=Kordiimonas sp. TaxID=1970157 RepID=UPI003A8F3950
MVCLTDNQYRHTGNSGARAALGLVFLLVVTACAAGGPSRRSVAPDARAQPIAPAVEQALCEGRATDAARILTSEPLSSPADRFYTGLALEESGRPIAARRIYASLMTSGARDTVFVHCGNTVLADGPISAEAGRRLALVATRLQAMDVARTEPLQFTGALPTTREKPADTTRKTPASSAATAQRSDVTRPSGSSPLGRWFAHFASYRSYDHAMTGKSSLEKQYPALSGIIDQWEVNVGGYALRLGVRLSDRADASSLCAQVKSQGEYCAVMDTSQ